jgi:hypothetical protein
LRTIAHNSCANAIKLLKWTSIQSLLGVSITKKGDVHAIDLAGFS